MKNQVFTYALNAENVDIIAESVQSFISGKKYDQDIALRTRLSVEMLLLHWMDNAAGQGTVNLEYSKRFGRIHVVLSFAGDYLPDPLEKDEDEFFNAMVSNMETIYSYTYKKGQNIADIKLPLLPVSNLMQIVIAGTLALLLGSIMNATLPADFNAMLNTNYVNPCFKTIVGVLSTFATFMVFFSILSSVANMGNVATLKNMGNTYVKQIMGSTFVWGAVCMIMSACSFGVINLDNAAGAGAVDKILSLLGGIIPVNIVGAFYKVSMLQIVVLALFIGCIMLMLGDEVAGIRKLISEFNKLFQYAIRVICKLIPLLIFLSFMKIILSNSIGTALECWKILAMHNFCYLLVLAGITVQTALHCKISLSEHIKKCMPLYCLGFSSGSSVPCLPTSRKLLEENQVEAGVIDFALPMGVVISKRTRVLYYIILVLGLFAVFNQTIAVGQLVVLLISSMLLSYATPSIPGGALAVITLFLEQFGLPIEAVGIAISLNFFDAMPAAGVKTVCTFNDVMYLHGTLQKSKK